MKRTWRTYIALLMSLVLTVFTTCQAQAMTSSVPSNHGSVMMASAVCHHGNMKHASDCMNACQNQQQADLAKKAHTLDMAKVIVAYNLPAFDQANYAPLQVTPPEPVTLNEPHPTIRFQRFLE